MLKKNENWFSLRILADFPWVVVLPVPEIAITVSRSQRKMCFRTFDKNDVKGKTGSGVLELEGSDVEATAVIRALKESAVRASPLNISTRTFARPKKGRYVELGEKMP